MEYHLSVPYHRSHGGVLLQWHGKACDPIFSHEVNGPGSIQRSSWIRIPMTRNNLCLYSAPIRKKNMANFNAHHLSHRGSVLQWHDELRQRPHERHELVQDQGLAQLVEVMPQVKLEGVV